jgi:hypothetical protein
MTSNPQQQQQQQQQQKILITSTGRSGTTFVTLLYIFLNQDVNFTKETYQQELSKFYITNCGLEGDYTSESTVIKNPNFLYKIAEIQKHIHIKYIIFPWRNFIQSAISRAYISQMTPNGGLWNATDVESQIAFYKKSYKIFLLDTTRYKIPVIYLDFEQLILDPYYVYQSLKPTFTNPQTTETKTQEISFDEFLLAYYQATDVHHRKPPRQSLYIYQQP